MFWQMCLNQQCVDVSSVDTVDCGDCSTQGVSHFVIYKSLSQWDRSELRIIVDFVAEISISL